MPYFDLLHALHKENLTALGSKLTGILISVSLVPVLFWVLLCLQTSQCKGWPNLCIAF